MQSSYYDEITDIRVELIGAWRLEIGLLPDGRYAVDHYSPAAPRKQRRYFETEAEATKYVDGWRR